MKAILSNMLDEVVDVAEADVIQRMFILDPWYRRNADDKRNMIPIGIERKKSSTRYREIPRECYIVVNKKDFHT